MNKPRKQGTAAETRIVNLHCKAGLQAWRLAEGGGQDRGDVEVWDHRREISITGEVKDRERLSAQEALEKAVRKSGTHRTALFWSQPVPGGLRRRRRRCVVITEELWLELIGGDSRP